MRQSTPVIGLLLAGALMLPGPDGSRAFAAGKKEAYVIKQGHQETLVNDHLQGTEGKKIIVKRVSFPPGWKSAKHYHTGPVYVYVLSGSVRVSQKDNAPRTFAAGSLFQEPIGNPMQAQNLSTSQPYEALVIQIGTKGQPLKVKADF